MSREAVVVSGFPVDHEACLPPLVLTSGEPAGIGPDLTLALHQQRHVLNVPPFLVTGDPQALAERARLLNLDVSIREAEPSEAASVFRHHLPVLPCGARVTARPGQPDMSSGPAALASIDMAFSLVQSGRARALVTNPIAKAVLYEAGFSDPGHTEYLARLAQRAGAAVVRPVMLLWSQAVATCPVTIHEPLADVPRLLTQELIVETGAILAADLTRRFGIRAPRLALSGLNPHAGEGGALGLEDENVVAPAVAALRALGIDARGPLPADTMFHAGARSTYDVALCMYHDQALIPVKTLAFDEAVNVTLGLPFLRTSPDHGTAFDLAGTGRGRPDSLLAALRLADRLTRAATPQAVS
jgi:4-hydroxythreonine-4-phosphate dehydrogenase